jgi:indoleamine 2,3-dioxygenase
LLLTRRPAEAIELYDRSVTALGAFRGQHLDYADRYIHRQSSTGLGNPTTRGTGGTPFMAYLRKHLDETLAHRIG